MSYSVTNYHSLEAEKTVNYEEISLEKGKVYSGSLMEGEELSFQKNALISNGEAVKSTSSIFNQDEKIKVEKIKLSKTSIELPVGETETLTAEILPESASVKTVTWNSADSGIAKIDEYGTITAVSAGKTTVYCKILDGSVTSKCEVSEDKIKIEPELI